MNKCCPSPACPIYDAPVEYPKHYFLYCLILAALRLKLFSSAAQLLGNRWHCASDKKKNRLVLNGIFHDDFDTNIVCMLFFSRPIIYYLVQPFLLTSIPLCNFVRLSLVICLVNSISSLDKLLALRANVVINIVLKKILTMPAKRWAKCQLNR